MTPLARRKRILDRNGDIYRDHAFEVKTEFLEMAKNEHAACHGPFLRRRAKLLPSRLQDPLRGVEHCDCPGQALLLAFLYNEGIIVVLDRHRNAVKAEVVECDKVQPAALLGA